MAALERRSVALIVAILLTSVAGVAPTRVTASSAISAAVPVIGGTLSAPGGAPGDDFAWSVAISGNTAVVGAPDRASHQGAVYVFVQTAGSWVLQATLTGAGTVAGDQFGGSVAIDGDTVLAGAPGVSSLAGIVDVFQRTDGMWSEETTLKETHGTAGDRFGQSVALSNGTALVGASGQAGSTGAAFLFTGSGSSWTPEASFDGEASGDLYGFTVALSSDTAIVGAPDRGSNTGAAYVLTSTGTGWTQQARLQSGIPGASFGFSVAVSGDTAVIGSQSESSEAGAAYVYGRTAGVWAQTQRLAGAAAGDNFGQSVALAGSSAMVGAPNAGGTGRAYLYDLTGALWTQVSVTNGQTTGDYLGLSVALSGGIGLIGAPRVGSATGSALVLEPDLTVAARGVGVTPALFYPVKDGYLDVLTIRGTLDESAAVSVAIYSVNSGKKVRGFSLGIIAGAYHVFWDGRDISGTPQPAGRYRVVQTLVDVAGNVLVSTAYTTLSLKRLYPYTASQTRAASPFNGGQAKGDAAILQSAKFAHGVLLDGGTEPSLAWVGYAFHLTSATIYKTVTCAVLGQSVPGRGPALIYVRNWVTDDFDGNVYSRTGYGWTSTSVSGSAHVAADRQAECFVNAYSSKNASYDIAQVKLTYSYGVLK